MNGRTIGFDLLGIAPEWQERALCSQTDPEAFFPEKGGSTREAKRICNRCEVRAECLEYALGTTSGSASGAGCRAGAAPQAAGRRPRAPRGFPARGRHAP